MAAPALRIPLGLDTQGFEKSIGEAKSLTSSAADFMVKEFAKMQARSVIKLAVQSDQFKPAVQSATKFLGDQFAAVKPQIQSFTQTAVKETTEAGLKVASVFASPAIKGSFQAFTAVGVPAAAGLAQALLPIAARALLVAEALHLVSEAVGIAREQITEMIAIADKASNVNVTPQFLQLFEGESRKLKVTVDELDTALTNAFNATKDKSPIDLAKWEVANERITDTELALRVYNEELQKSTGKGLQGLVLFRDAQTQDDKVKSILASMVELDKVGQHLQSLELGEKFFGSTFVDRIRQGKTSAEGILDSMEKLKASQDGLFPDALVNRAKAVDDQLKLSQDRLSRALKPSWDDLASVILSIKGYWSDVVVLMAKAVEYSNKIKIPFVPSNDLESKQSALDQVQKRLAGQAGGGFDSLDSVLRSANGGELPAFIKNGLVEQASRLRSEILNATVPGGQAAAPPTRGTGDAPTQKKTDNGRDPFEAAIDVSKRHTATLEAETATIDENNAARERAKTVAQLEEAAKRANTAAGKANTEVTKEQRDEINKEADAVQKAADAYARKQVQSQIKFDAGTAFLSQSDVAIATQLRGIYGTDIPAALNSSYASAIRFNEASKEIANTLSTNLTTGLADVIDGTKTAGQAFQDFSKVVIRAIEEAIIKIAIVGPLMRSLQGGFSSIFGGATVPGAVGPTSVGGAPLVPGFASGTDYAPGGMAWVGESGPELVNLPRGSQVVPNAISSRGGGDIQVNLIEDSSRAGQVNKTTGSNGGIRLDVMVDSITAKNAGDPGSATSAALSSRGRVARR